MTFPCGRVIPSHRPCFLRRALPLAAVSLALTGSMLSSGARAGGADWQVRWRVKAPSRPQDELGLVSGMLSAKGKPQIVARTPTGALVIDTAGRVVRKLTLPPGAGYLALAHTAKGARFLGWDVWGSSVRAFDPTGKVLWSYSSRDAVKP